MAPRRRRSRCAPVTDPASSGLDPGGTGGAAAGPADDEWGVPVGYRNGEPGARAAAVGWVAALGPLMRMGPVATGDTLRALMSDQAATDTIATFRDERSRFARQFGADPANAIWVESPLQVDVVEITDGSATVRGVVAAAGRGADRFGAGAVANPDDLAGVGGRRLAGR